MRKVVVSEFVSLDGVMEDPGGGEQFEHGGWTVPYGGDDIWQFKRDELLASDALLLGRVTYEGFAAAWPSVTDEQGFADRMNSLPKYVVSGSLTDPRWNNSRIVKGDIATEVARLKQQRGENILVGGSAMLVQALMRLDLVDEFRLLVYPVVLGCGKRLFHDGATTTLTLVEAKTFTSGVVCMVYRAQSDRAIAARYLTT
jgi:dihydrofolate reductase